jgi:hypothetical protein
MGCSLGLACPFYRTNNDFIHISFDVAKHLDVIKTRKVVNMSLFWGFCTDVELNQLRFTLLVVSRASHISESSVAVLSFSWEMSGELDKVA